MFPELYNAEFLLLYIMAASGKIFIYVHYRMHNPLVCFRYSMTSGGYNAMKIDEIVFSISQEPTNIQNEQSVILHYLI